MGVLILLRSSPLFTLHFAKLSYQTSEPVNSRDLFVVVSLDGMRARFNHHRYLSFSTLMVSRTIHKPESRQVAFALKKMLVANKVYVR